jgi:hypothetical protein
MRAESVGVDRLAARAQAHDVDLGVAGVGLDLDLLDLGRDRFTVAVEV